MQKSDSFINDTTEIFEILAKQVPGMAKNKPHVIRATWYGLPYKSLI